MVLKVETDEQRRQALAVRRAVFVDEQKVAADEEFDDFENVSVHFVAVDEDGQGCGAARWRITADGVKLERFAVSRSHRGQGIGSDLVRAVLADIAAHPIAQSLRPYLYAQVQAAPFYEKFGFTPFGERFDECRIEHQAMEIVP